VPTDRSTQIELLCQAVREHGTGALTGVDPDLRRDVEARLRGHSLSATVMPPHVPAANTEAPTEVGPGSQLGPYRIEALLGMGGMGRVFRASDPRLGRDVAIKVSQRDFTDRFEREARAIAALNHPHVCTLYDVGPNYLVMELVEGETLATRLQRGKLSLKQTVEYAGQIASALAFAHTKGIVHRDLKPGNIMLTRSGAKVLDFGLAKSSHDDTLTVANMVLGTPAYMAPEQRAGKACDARADIYALGILVYEMANGSRPVPGEPLGLDSLPERLGHVVERCLAQDPDERWQSASDVKSELEWAGRGAVTTRPPASTARAGRFGLVLRRPMVWAALAAVLAALAGGFAWYAHDGGSGPTLAAVDRTIAVLPFENYSSDADQDHFASGLTEEILNSLARIPDLQVTARTSAFAFKGKAEDLKAVGRTLGVAHVLEGSVQRSGNRLRITTQLIRADTGFHTWSETYDRQLTDIFTIQDDIARAVAGALQVKLGVGIGQQPGMTRNVEAYQAWLAARGVTYTGVASMRRYIEQMEQVVALDPTFAQPWWDLSAAYSSVLSGTVDDAAVRRQKADAAFAEYRRLLPDSPRIHERLAEDSVESGDMIAAAEHYRAAADATSRLYGGKPIPVEIVGQAKTPIGFADLVGRPRESIPLFEQARTRDPLNVVLAMWLAYLYGSVGDYPAAFAEFERSERLAKDSRIYAVSVSIALGSRDRQQLLPWLDKAIEFEKTRGTDFYARMKRLLDKPAEALDVLHALPPGRRFVGAIGRTQWFAWFGDDAAALEEMRAGLQTPGSRWAVLWAIWEPGLAGVRKLPGFKQLMRDAGLVDYWRKYGWGDYCKPTTVEDFECDAGVGSGGESSGGGASR
jgi:TolB-like protein/tetratricopeptide (TPR) repeat protein/predicted Ser/Thr protein kinase